MFTYIIHAQVMGTQFSTWYICVCLSASIKIWLLYVPICHYRTILSPEDVSEFIHQTKM